MRPVMVKSVMKKTKKTVGTRVHYSPYLKGVIFGLFLAGTTYREIAEEVVKPDGTHPCQQSVASVVEKAEKLEPSEPETRRPWVQVTANTGEAREQKARRRALQKRKKNQKHGESFRRDGNQMPRED